MMYKDSISLGDEFTRLCTDEKIVPPVYILHQLQGNGERGAGVLQLTTRTCSLPVCKALSYLLPQTDSVFHLDLSDCLLTTDCLEILLNGVRNNSSIASLNLKGNNIGGSSLTALGKLLLYSSSLKRLSVEWNCISSDIVCFNSFCSGLSKNNGLECLNIRNNQLSHVAVISLTSALQYNSSLRYLDLSWNNIGVSGGNAVLDLLAVNRTIERIDLQGNNIPKQLLLLIESEFIQNKETHCNPITHSARSQSSSQITCTSSTGSAGISCTSTQLSQSTIQTQISQASSTDSMGNRLKPAQRSIECQSSVERSLEFKSPVERSLEFKSSVERSLECQSSVHRSIECQYSPQSHTSSDKDEFDSNANTSSKARHKKLSNSSQENWEYEKLKSLVEKKNLELSRANRNLSSVKSKLLEEQDECKRLLQQDQQREEVVKCLKTKLEKEEELRKEYENRLEQSSKESLLCVAGEESASRNKLPTPDKFKANDDIVLDKVDTKQLKEQLKQDREEYRTRITTLEQDLDRLRKICEKGDRDVEAWMRKYRELEDELEGWMNKCKDQEDEMDELVNKAREVEDASEYWKNKFHVMESKFEDLQEKFEDTERTRIDQMELQEHTAKLEIQNLEAKYREKLTHLEQENFKLKRLSKESNEILNPATATSTKSLQTQGKSANESDENPTEETKTENDKEKENSENQETSEKQEDEQITADNQDDDNLSISSLEIEHMNSRLHEINEMIGQQQRILKEQEQVIHMNQALLKSQEESLRKNEKNHKRLVENVSVGSLEFLLSDCDCPQCSYTTHKHHNNKRSTPDPDKALEHCDHACQHEQEHQHPAKRQTTRAENCNQGRKGPKQHDMEAQIEWQRAEENLKDQIDDLVKTVKDANLKIKEQDEIIKKIRYEETTRATTLLNALKTYIGESNANCELAALFPILSPQPNQDSETSPSPDSRTNSDGASSQGELNGELHHYPRSNGFHHHHANTHHTILASHHIMSAPLGGGHIMSAPLVGGGHMMSATPSLVRLSRHPPGIASAMVGRASSVGRPASVGRPSVDLHHQQLYFKPEKNVRRANSFHDMEGNEKYEESIVSPDLDSKNGNTDTKRIKSDSKKE